MANRQLTESELKKARNLLNRVRAALNRLADEDAELLFAYRRKVYKELSYDERDNPMARRRLKDKKRKSQGNVCPCCKKRLPKAGCPLDRFNAIDGYTDENTRLICPACDAKIQASRRYK